MNRCPHELCRGFLVTETLQVGLEVRRGTEDLFQTRDGYTAPISVINRVGNIRAAMKLTKEFQQGRESGGGGEHNAEGEEAL